MLGTDDAKTWEEMEVSLTYGNTKKEDKQNKNASRDE